MSNPIAKAARDHAVVVGIGTTSWECLTNAADEIDRLAGAKGSSKVAQDCRTLADSHRAGSGFAARLHIAADEIERLQGILNLEGTDAAEIKKRAHAEIKREGDVWRKRLEEKEKEIEALGKSREAIRAELRNALAERDSAIIARTKAQDTAREARADATRWHNELADARSEIEDLRADLEAARRPIRRVRAAGARVLYALSRVLEP